MRDMWVAFVFVVFSAQSLYMIWLVRAYNRGRCRRCKYGEYLYYDVLKSDLYEDAEDAFANVKCSCCGYKDYVPSELLARGKVPYLAVCTWILSMAVFLCTIGCITRGVL